MSSKVNASSHEPQGLRSVSSFAELMALEQLNEPTGSHSLNGETEKISRFRSLAAPFPPGEGPRAFGGHVYAQSAYAASKTVEKGFLICDVAGTFILGGLLDVPYVFTVRHIRDGGMYCTRAVDARQNGQVCFSCLCSFKRDENQQTFNHQPLPAQKRFKSLLDGKRPEDHLSSPSVDADWWIQHVQQGDVKEREFPGLNVRKVDMKNYNQTEDVKLNPEKFRQLALYSLKGSPEDFTTYSKNSRLLRERDQSGEFDNLYACAHMYASDKNSLLLIPRALGHENWSAMASLSLTVIFHQHGPALRMIDWDSASMQDGETVSKKWFVQEGWTPRSGENRAVHESYLFSPDGTLVATTLQDSMLRLKKVDRGGKL